MVRTLYLIINMDVHLQSTRAYISQLYSLIDGIHSAHLRLLLHADLHYSCHITMILFLSAVIGFIAWACLCPLYRNIVAARKSGIPYLIVPFQPYTFGSRLTYPVWKHLLPHLPQSWDFPHFMDPDLQWGKLYAPFKRINSDTVLLCSPGQIVLHTCAADVIRQVISRKDDFPKPAKLYKIVDIFGPSVISTEGHEWKKHRRALSAVYTHRTYKLVWDESIHQFKSLLDSFMGTKTSVSSKDLTVVDSCINQATLAVISHAAYGVSLQPSLAGGTQIESRQPAPSSITQRSSDIFQDEWVKGKTHGHTLPYVNAIRGITSNILWIACVPKGLLRVLPFERARYALSAYVNFGQYMREMISERRLTMEMVEHNGQYGTDLLSSLVKSTQVSSNTESKAGNPNFTDDELLADIFITMIGGHKTTATTIRFGLLLLAMNVSSQRALQQHLDRILQGRKPEEWSYDDDFKSLFKAMPGAVIAEVLRWLPPILSVPKLAVKDQPLTINGHEATVPQDTLVAINVVAAHRNPKQWPGFSTVTKSECGTVEPLDDMDQFKPERWLNQSSNKDGNDLGVVAEAAEITTDAVDGVYKPVSGSYLPFSAGGRICLGRQFAQTEAVVALAVLFQNYSIELSVQEWATDEQVENMTTDEKESLWEKARQAALSKFRNNVECLLSADMKGVVPVRFVKRGEERFP